MRCCDIVFDIGWRGCYGMGVAELANDSDLFRSMKRWQSTKSARIGTL